MRATGERAQPYEALVRVGRLGEPVEQEGQQLLHEPRGAGEAPRELAQGLAGPLRVGEAEGGEALLGGVESESVLDARLIRSPRPARCCATGEGLEQGPEEQTLVDRPPGALMAGEDGVEAVCRGFLRPSPEPEHPCQAVPRFALGRDGVHLGLFDELEAVLDGPQEPVREGESRRVPGCHVPGVGQLGQCRQGRPQAKSGVAAAVDELQQLHGELHVPDPPAATLELTALEAPAGDDRLRAGLHRAQLCELVGAEAPGPKVLGRRLFEATAAVGLTRGVPRLQERLELPGAGPTLPVGDVGGDRAYEHPGAALRAQVRVDAVGARGEGDDRTGEGRVDLGGVGGHEDDVEVACVVDLLGTVLSEGDDGEAACRPREGDGAG